MGMNTSCIVIITALMPDGIPFADDGAVNGPTTIFMWSAALVRAYACTCPKGYQSLGNTLRPVKALLPHSSDSSQFPSTCSSLPLVFGRSNVAC